MNIEELFENEKWAGYGIVVTDDANQSIDYLKEEVMEYVAGLQKRIAELETSKDNYKQMVVEQKQHIAELETSIDHLRHGGKVQREQINRMEGILNDIRVACDEAGREKESPKTIAGFIEDQAARIAELEAQLPKVVKPQILPVLDRKCECGAALDYGVNYCNNCGAKLVWRDA